jgi:hypothetical protein
MVVVQPSFPRSKFPDRDDFPNGGEYFADAIKKQTDIQHGKFGGIPPRIADLPSLRRCFSGGAKVVHNCAEVERRARPAIFAS